VPDNMGPEETKAYERFLENGTNRLGKRELRDFENVSEYHLGHIILSDNYSIIFEPFELYSEYYGAVNKKKTTIATISHGFEHYLNGLFIKRFSAHGSFSSFDDKMRKNMWEILQKYSMQEKL